MFVPPDQLKINLQGLIEKAIADWSETQPRGFSRPVVEQCGDFIVAGMDARGLRSLHGDEPWFNGDATAKELRECVFTALDHWLVNAEISGEPVPEETRMGCVPAADSPSKRPVRIWLWVYFVLALAVVYFFLWLFVFSDVPYFPN